MAYGHTGCLQPGLRAVDGGLTGVWTGRYTSSAGARTCRVGCDHSWIPSLPVVFGPVTADTCRWEARQNLESYGDIHCPEPWGLSRKCSRKLVGMVAM